MKWPAAANSGEGGGSGSSVREPSTAAADQSNEAVQWQLEAHDWIQLQKADPECGLAVPALMQLEASNLHSMSFEAAATAATTISPAEQGVQSLREQHRRRRHDERRTIAA